MFNLNYFLDRFLFFTGSTTFKWANGVATLLLLLSVLMSLSGELICIWYSTNVADVKASLLFVKYSTRIGDVLVRGHKLMIATAFVAVFFHMGKAFAFGVFYGTRSSSWKSGFLLLLVIFGVSYVGCILPWTVLSPTLYTMVQTILDTYLGGWSVFVLLGGEKLPMSILARTLIAHILLGVVGLIVLGVHLRVVHFIGSSVNRFYTWVTMDRPLWLPNELVKEAYLLFFYFFFFFFMLYKKSANWGSTFTSLYKFYYGGATNWNNLPASIEPEWYFWIFYFVLASASSLLGGLLRIGLLFLLLFSSSVLKVAQCPKSVDSLEDIALNGALMFFFLLLFFIFFTRAKGSFWHIYVLDSILLLLFFGEILFSFSSGDLYKKVGVSFFRRF